MSTSQSTPASAGPTTVGGRYTLEELRTQPQMWRRAAETPDEVLDLLPATGAKALVLGCGTSYYIGESYARRRVAADRGPTRAAIPSELDYVEPDEQIILISRSGTTGDLLRVGDQLRDTHPVVAITGAPDTPIARRAGERNISLAYADEQSVMQTRFATTGLALLRHSLDDDLERLAAEGDAAVTSELPLTDDALAQLQHVVFLGTRESAGLAQEAALKIREAAGFWTEAYPIFEYQHGPISCAGPNSLVWSLTELPDSVVEGIHATGARLVVSPRDAHAELIRVHRLAVSLAIREGRDPDTPPHLSRSVEATEI